MITTHHGDNTVVLPTLDAASVQCVVTSPPYYGLRDYKLPPTDWPAVEYTPLAGLPPVVVPAMSCCLGLERDPLAYVAHLVYTWRLLWRVLRDDGVCFLNLGDSYSGSWGNYSGQNRGNGSQRTITNGSKAHQQAYDGLESWRPPTSNKIEGIKNKDLLGIPWRVAYALQADGWYLRSDIIWSKPNPMPESVTDRPTKAHEYLFLLAKNERYYYDSEAIAEQASESSGWAKQRGKGVNTWDYGRDGYNEARIGGMSGKETYENTGKRNRRTVWSIATQPYSGAHFAVMPEALIDPCVRAGSAAQACEGCGAPWERVSEPTGHVSKREPAHVPGNTATKTDSTGWAPTRRATDAFRPTCACPGTIGAGRSIVLDLYAGSGTTGRVAEKLSRDAVLIELNGDYIDLQETRTNGVQKELLL